MYQQENIKDTRIKFEKAGMAIGTKWRRKGETITITSIVYSLRKWRVGSGQSLEYILDNFELVKEEPTTKYKRNLAFYKESGEPWEIKEMQNIQGYCSDIITNSLVQSRTNRKWFFDCAGSTQFMFTWKEQENHSNFKNCEQVSYESIFNNTPIPKEVQTPKYKVGDIVQTDYNWYTDSKVQIAKIENGYYFYKDIKNSETGFDEICIADDREGFYLVDTPKDESFEGEADELKRDILKTIPEEETMLLKGDTYRCIQSPIGCSAQPGKIYTQKENSMRMLPIECPCTWEASYFELVGTTTAVASIKNEEKTMNPNVTITMTAKELNKCGKANKVRKSESDFQTRKPFTVKAYNPDGSINKVHTQDNVKSLKVAKKLEQAFLADAFEGARFEISKVVSTRKRKPCKLVKV